MTTTTPQHPYQFGCDLAFLQLILRALAKLPFEESAGAIDSITRLIQEQDKARVAPESLQITPE